MFAGVKNRKKHFNPPAYNDYGYRSELKPPIFTPIRPHIPKLPPGIPPYTYVINNRRLMW